MNKNQIRNQKDKHIVTKLNEFENTNQGGLIIDNERKTSRTTCPVCQFTVPSQCNLKLHMQAKCDVKCQDCNLYFSSCQSILIHKKGRCKKILS